MIYVDGRRRSPTSRRLVNHGGWMRWWGEPLPTGSTLVRWGMGSGYPRPRTNSVLFIGNERVIADKYYQWQRLHPTVPVPQLVTSYSEWEHMGFPQIIAKPRHGQSGRGIYVVSSSDYFDTGHYIYQMYHDKTREFRVVVVNGVPAYIMEKHSPYPNCVTWNKARGATWTRLWRFDRQNDSDTSLIQNLLSIAKTAVTAMNYGIGGVDIMLTTDNKLLVLEVNSIPGLGKENIYIFIRLVNQIAYDWAVSRGAYGNH